MDMFSVATYKDSTTSLLERNEAPLDVLTLTSLSNGFCKKHFSSLLQVGSTAQS